MRITCCLMALFCFIMASVTMNTKGHYKPYEREYDTWVEGNKPQTTSIGAVGGAIAGVVFWLTVGGVGIVTGGTAVGLGLVGLGSVGLGLGALTGAAIGSTGYQTTVKYTEYVYQSGYPAWVSPTFYMAGTGFAVLCILLCLTKLNLTPVEQ